MSDEQYAEFFRACQSLLAKARSEGVFVTQDEIQTKAADLGFINVWFEFLNTFR